MHTYRHAFRPRVLSLILLLLLLIPASANAQETRRYRDMLQRHNQKITDLEKKDPEGLVKQDLLQIQKHIQDAQFKLGQEEYELADQKLRLIEARITLADAKLAFQKAKVEADQKSGEAEEMLKRQADLDAKLEGIKGQIKMLKETSQK